MAIYHCSVKAVSRGAGRSAPAAAAYRAGEKIIDERTGQVFDYTRRGGVESTGIVLPEGAASNLLDRSTLWNAAEAAEKRKDACVAREYEVALPHELSAEQRRELVADFARELSARHGVAVDFAIHTPGKEGDNRNHHAHILTTTRVAGPDGLAGKADIEHAGRNRRADLEATRALWEDVANRHLERAGLDVRIDRRSYRDQKLELAPTTHVGVHAVAMDRRGMPAERIDLHSGERQKQAEQIAQRPEIIFDKLTTTQAVFTRHDIARELNRYIDDAGEFQTIMARLEQSPQIVELAPEVRGTSGNTLRQARYSTREMIEAERRMVDTAERMHGQASHGVASAKVDAAVSRAGTLSNEQEAAVRHVTGAGQIAAVIGDAGTGKSFSMQVARQSWEAQGFRVRGAALAGKAADGLQEGSGIESRTLASLERSWERGKDKLTSRDVLVIDEAGMVGSRQLGRVLAEADKAGAKVVLLGDAKQLAAIEAGAGFRAITERTGAAEIMDIRRQREGWAREASHAFARGSAADGLAAYQQRGCVRMLATREQARAELAEAYLADQGGGSSIILAHSNADVQALNQTVRKVRRERGELGGEARFQTDRGGRDFAAGDRIVFLRNDAALGVKNGTLGTVEHSEGGRLSVRLDNGEQRQVNQDAYAALDHGYAVTIHKAQGVTVDRAHVLASGGMDRSLAYVAMTRHRDQATLYAGRDDFADYDALARRLNRQRPKESTLDFADRRGFDGASVVTRWIERGRSKLKELGGRAQQAIRTAFERSGRAVAEAPTLEGMSPATITPRTKAAPTLRQRFARAVAHERGELASGQRTDRDELAGFQAAIEQARRSGDPMQVTRAEMAAEIATEYAKQGKNPRHHAGAIQQQAERRMVERLAGQAQAVEKPAPTARPSENAKAQDAKAERIKEINRTWRATEKQRDRDDRGRGR